MKVQICEENVAAEEFIPPNKPDGSGIGINYADQYIKPIKHTLEDGRKIACKRRGLKITLSVGSTKGEAIMRRIEHGPDVKVILRKALEEAAKNANATFLVEKGAIFLEVSDN